jgi:hypothetical protein
MHPVISLEAAPEDTVKALIKRKNYNIIKNIIVKVVDKHLIISYT